MRSIANPRRLAVHESPTAPFSSLERLWLIAAVAAYIGARLVHLGSFRLWFDEIFTMEVGTRQWGSLLWFVQNYDVHPPLFYALVKLWTQIGGESFLWLGLFPAITAIAVLVPLVALMRELRLRPSEIALVITLMAFNGYLSGYAQEFRAYDWLLLLSVTSLWLFVRFTNEESAAGRTLIALAAVNLALVYTHYYAWLVVGTEGLFLLGWSWRKVWAFAATAAIAVVVYLPWAYRVVQAAARRVGAGDKVIFFIPRPSLFSIAFFYGALNGLYEAAHTTMIGLAIFGLPVMVWIWTAARDRERQGDRPALAWLLLFSTVPVAVAFVASHLLPTAIWGQRHLIIVAAPYYILVAVALMRLPQSAIRVAAIGLVVGWAGLSGAIAQWIPYKTPAWDALAASVVAQTPTGRPTRVYAMNEDAAFPMRFYLARTGRDDIEVFVVQQDTPANRERLLSPAKKPYWALTVPIALIHDPGELGSGPFWICDDQDATNIGFPGRSLPEVFAHSGYTVTSRMDARIVNRRWNTRAVSVFSASSTLASR